MFTTQKDSPSIQQEIESISTQTTTTTTTLIFEEKPNNDGLFGTTPGHAVGAGDRENGAVVARWHLLH